MAKVVPRVPQTEAERPRISPIFLRGHAETGHRWITKVTACKRISATALAPSTERFSTVDFPLCSLFNGWISFSSSQHTHWWLICIQGLPLSQISKHFYLFLHSTERSPVKNIFGRKWSQTKIYFKAKCPKGCKSCSGVNDSTSGHCTGSLSQRKYSPSLVCSCTILCKIIFHFISDSTAKMREKVAGAPPRQKNVYIFWQGDMKRSLRVQSVINIANNFK